MANEGERGRLDVVAKLLKQDHLQKIRLGRGVVGKATSAWLGLAGVFAVVAWKLAEAWMLLTLGGIAGAVFLAYLIMVMVFSHKNPATSLLEGAELVQFYQMEAATKHQLSPPAAPPILDPTRPALPAPDETEEDDGDSLVDPSAPALPAGKGQS